MKKTNLKNPILLLTVLLTLCDLPVFAQDKVTVSGTVFSAEDGQPLPGAAVLADELNAVITDIDGKFSISVDAGATLTASCLGYSDRTFTVPTEDAVWNVGLESETHTIDDVVVIAYGVRKKGTIAGSVSTVKSEKLADVPAASFDQALQGQTPGLTVLSSSGEPSTAATFQIRGINSINSGTSPLFILDGLPVSSSDFNAINPADIESVSVLKDASSTSIYGARAANGVVVITTKRGSLGKAKVTARAQVGFSSLARNNWNMMNTAERIAYEKEVGLTDGKDYAALSQIDYNWLEEVFRNDALLQNYDVSVDGSTDKVRYYVSGNFYDQQGISLDSHFRRYNVRANVEAQAKSWLKIGTNVLLTHEDINISEQGAPSTVTPISASRFMLPYWSPYKADGKTYASVSDGTWKGTDQNPLEWMENNPASNDKNKIIGSLFLEFTPIEGLTIRSQGGVDYSGIYSMASSMPSYVPNNGMGSATKSYSEAYNLTITNTVNYHFALEHVHDFNFLVGQEAVDYTSDGFSIATSGQQHDELTNIASGTVARSWVDNTSSYSYLSFFGRGEYNYGGRYYADFSVRADASSRFGKSGRWAAFWSLGFMWDLRNEKFMRGVAPWLTMAQVAVSTGTSGNSSIPNYDHLDLVGGGSDYLGNSGISPVSQGNENLEWEKLWTTNLAFHLGFIGRIGLDIELYNKYNYNMLMAVPQSYANGGFSARWDNVGAMLNRGVEFNIGADIIRTRDFVWNVAANASYNHNEITELYNGVQEYVMSETGTKLVVGHPFGEFFMNRYAGVNPANGEQRWLDKDGNVTDEYNDSDKVMTGCSYIAPWQGGFSTALSWKGLTLSAQFSWVADRWVINNDRYYEENSLFDSYNQSRRMLYDRWKKPGDVTDIPKYGETPQLDTRYLEDASFLRLKNLSIAYSFPEKLLSTTKVFNAVKIYAQAQNLLTFTGFTGLDPENVANVYRAQYPMSKQFTFGVELTF